VKLIYLGLPLGALMLYREGHDLAAACISRPSMPGMRRLRQIMSTLNAPLLGRPDLTQPAVQALLASTDADLVVSWFWTRRIPATMVALAPRGGVNVHPSLLPRHRGADPYFWTLALGDAETGVTAHRITARYDEGDILLQRKMAVPPDVNAGKLARLLDRPSLEVLRDVVDLIERGEETAIPQDTSLATQAPKPTDEDCELIWDLPVDAVLRTIRAASPDPGAFTGFGDDTLVILKARKAEKVPRGLEPGDVALTPEGVLIACRGGEGIVVLEAAREGEERTRQGRDVAALIPGIGVVSL
jgi:methionyl-tRNA formyltransferase